MLSVIIPTYNEQEFLPGCLKSVQFADEIVVVDSGSTDRTVAIAKRYGSKIFRHPWAGFASAHNFGASKAKGDWLLFVDADERVSRILRRQILEAVTGNIFDAFQIKRQNFIMGQALRHGGWYPDYVTRLMRKKSLKQWVGQLHEYPQINGRTSRLSAHLFHLSHRGLTWMMHKSITYTQLTAQILYQNGHPPVKVKNFFGAMGREFYLRAIRNSGWRDGFIGWLEIVYQTFNAFLIQVYLWELQQKQPMAETYRKIDEEISREL